MGWENPLQSPLHPSPANAAEAGWRSRLGGSAFPMRVLVGLKVNLDAVCVCVYFNHLVVCHPSDPCSAAGAPGAALLVGDVRVGCQLYPKTRPGPPLQPAAPEMTPEKLLNPSPCVPGVVVRKAWLHPHVLLLPNNFLVGTSSCSGTAVSSV